MKLLFAKPSPFARKVRVVVSEKGLEDRITEVPVDPFGADDKLRDANPLGKVPCLILENGDALYDSPVICEYLDQTADVPRLIPQDGPDRWHVLRRTALADGLLDAAVSMSMEINRREEDERSQTWIDRWTSAITRALDELETDISVPDQNITLADIAAGCALAYLDYRHKERIDWRDGHPKCAFWFEAFSARPSMQRTTH